VTSNKLTPILYESATTADTAATTVAAADIKGTALALLVDSTPQTVYYIGSKRYVGVNFDFTGTGISTVSLAVYAVGYRPMNAPQTPAAAVART
jgi:hypothetical protein